VKKVCWVREWPDRDAPSKAAPPADMASAMAMNPFVTSAGSGYLLTEVLWATSVVPALNKPEASL